MEFPDYTILIIDDEEGYRKFMRAVLEKSLKVKVAEAANPKRAFEYLEKNTPTLILLDMQMPVMDGYKALKLMRQNENTKNTPVIACTGIYTKDLLASLAKLRIADYIVKPVYGDVLLEKVARVLKKIEKNLPV
jgi:CheY-like chemotaxis protein